MSKFIVFECHQQQFALPIEEVDKILLFEEPTEVPDTTDYLLGVLPYENQKIVLLDLKKRLFQENLHPNVQTKIIVVHWKESKLGLVVENVSVVREFESLPNGTNESEGEDGVIKYIIQMFQTEQGIIMQIDVNDLLSNAGVKEIKSILEK